jgi:hypothetical protein
LATNEYEQPDPTPGFLVRASTAAHAATGTDARFPIRTLVALVCVAVAGASAPVPLAFVGVGAAVVLAVEVARLAWGKR